MMTDAPASDAKPALAPFDATDFWRRYGGGLPASKSAVIRDYLAAYGGEQRRIIEELPTLAIATLLRHVPVKAFFSLLGVEVFAELKRSAFKGFQSVAALVRQPTVQKRLLQHFESHRADLQAVLLLWVYGVPTPPIIEAVRQIERPDTQTTLRLIQQWGLNATLLALAAVSWTEEFEAARHFFNQPQELAAMLETLTETAPVEASPQTEASATTDWQSRALAAEQEAQAARQQVMALQKQVAAANTLRAQVVTLQSEITKAQNGHQQLVAQWEKNFENARLKFQSEREEVKRQEERQNRRAKAAERDKEELETENRKLQKQLRHTQGLLEEERKKLARFEQRETAPDTAPASGLPPPAPEVPAKPVKRVPLTLQDEVFEWMADGRRVRVTPREVRRLIDTNDEDSIFALMLALEALAASPRVADPELRHRFLHRMREIAPFYARVLTHTTTRALVDASNVARSQATRYGKGQLALLLQMRDELRRLDYWPIIFIADANLRHHIDQGKAFVEMIERGEIVPSDKGIEADEVLAREARRTGAVVVTNDTRFFHKVSPDFEPPRLSFRVVEDAVFVNEM